MRFVKLKIYTGHFWNELRETSTSLITWGVLFWISNIMPDPPAIDPVDPLAVLTSTLKALAPNLLTTLVTPTFDWDSTEKYDEFLLFTKSVNSWFMLQNIAPDANPDGTTSSTRLEYILNFLGNQGCRKYECWTPSGTAAEMKKKMDSAKEFMDYLLSTMDHEVAQCCRIYQLKDVRIWPGESPWWTCWLPSEEKKKHNVQYCFTHALNDNELVKKLLALELTAKMLEVCRTQIALSDNLDALSLAGCNGAHAIHNGKLKKQHLEGWKQNNCNQHQCGNCTKSYPPGHSSCPAKENICNKSGRLDHWKPWCHGGAPKKPLQNPNKGGKKGEGRGLSKRINEVGNDQNQYLDEIDVASVGLHQKEWLVDLGAADLEHIQISDVHIDATTEAFTVVQMPADIDPCQQATLKCKVDTGTGGNVMPLCAFTKLFPKWIAADRTPTGFNHS